MIEIKRYVSNLLSSNMYIINEGKHAIVIDPFDNVSYAQGLKVDYILLTHEHYDHISGVNAWKEATGALVLCSKACGDNIQNSKKNLANHFTEFCELQTWIKINKLPIVNPSFCCTADVTFEKELDFKWHNHQFMLFEMPGHSPGSIGILVDNDVFFSGDSLIENHQIETRFPGGSSREWERLGRKQLDKLPESIKVYPGHFSEFIFSRRGDI